MRKIREIIYQIELGVFEDYTPDELELVGLLLGWNVKEPICES